MRLVATGAESDMGSKNADVNKCTDCGAAGDALRWHCAPVNRGQAPDGRIRMHEVGITFFLGCEVCGETLKTSSGDEVAELLTQQLAG